MKQITLNLIGAGRVGRTFLHLLTKNQNCRIQDVLSANFSSAQNAVENVKAGRAVKHISDLRPADLWIIAVPDTTQLSLEELLENAANATSKRNYDEAIQLYWSALGRTNERADVWNALSKVYLIDGQAKNAATTALEATRLAPENIQYLLDYLRVVQRVKKAADFIKELEIAYDRFPNSPELTLSLARGYLRVGGNDYAAGILYRRFIEMAPDHPLRPEAEAALARMR